MNGRFRGLAVNVSLAVASASLFMVVGEGLARFLEKRRPARPARADYIWDWRDKMPGGFYVIRSEAVGWPPWEEINGDGLRDRSHAVEKPDGRRRVAVLGDSVALGDQIRPEEAFPRVLEGTLDTQGRPVDVLNVALWGWSTRQERLAWERIARKYEPDAVILAVCLNDIPELQNNLSQPPAWLAWLHGRSALVRWSIGADGREIGSVEQLFAAPDSTTVQEAMARFFQEVKDLREEVQSTGASFALVLFPFRFQVEKGAPDPVVQRRIMAFCRSSGISCVDLEPELRAVGPSAFVDYDHLSPSGARVVAAHLAGSSLMPTVEAFPRVLARALQLKEASKASETVLRWLEAKPDGGVWPAAPMREVNREGASGPSGRTLGRQESEIVSTVLARLLLASESRVRQAAAWGVRRLAGSVESRAELRPVVPALVERLSDPSEGVRAEVARALGGLGIEGRAGSAALFSLLEDPQQQVRWAAARALYDMGLTPAEDVTALANALSSEDEYVRGFAAFTLGEMGAGAAPAVPALAAALEKADGYGRGGASAALAKLGQLAAPAVPALMRGLDSEDGEKRWKAARTLGRIGPPARDSVPALVARLADPNERVRAQAVRALGRIAPQTASPALEQALHDPDATVRDEAKNALRMAR